jgi:hypothetical protein
MPRRLRPPKLYAKEEESVGLKKPHAELAMDFRNLTPSRKDAKLT